MWHVEISVHIYLYIYFHVLLLLAVSSLKNVWISPNFIFGRLQSIDIACPATRHWNKKKERKRERDDCGVSWNPASSIQGEENTTRARVMNNFSPFRKGVFFCFVLFFLKRKENARFLAGFRSPALLTSPAVLQPTDEIDYCKMGRCCIQELHSKFASGWRQVLYTEPFSLRAPTRCCAF